jgi:hypothetical protein
MTPSPFLEPLIAATLADPGAVLTTALRLSHLSRRWGFSGPLAGLLAALAYGNTPDE